MSVNTDFLRDIASRAATAAATTTAKGVAIRVVISINKPVTVVISPVATFLSGILCGCSNAVGISDDKDDQPKHAKYR